jgi:hypothetical protein
MRIHECRDTVVLQQHLTKLWETCPAQEPLQVGVWLFNLVPDAHDFAGLASDRLPASATCPASDPQTRPSDHKPNTVQHTPHASCAAFKTHKARVRRASGFLLTALSNARRNSACHHHLAKARLR